MEHGARYRRQQDSTCHPDGIQHILFVLDRSGSIGETEFKKVTATLSMLVALFCKPIKIAMMTFDHEYFEEFCFDHFDNTCGGRADAALAISCINYNLNDGTGVRYTHTAGAIDCVCDHMLSFDNCSLPLDATCIDVIFITDGLSNDPNRDVCVESRSDDMLCLHNNIIFQGVVNTFAIGIANAHEPELQCINNNAGESYLFNFRSFDDFEMQFQKAMSKLAMGDTNADGDPYVCIDPKETSPGAGTGGCEGLDQET